MKEKVVTNLQDSTDRVLFPSHVNCFTYLVTSWAATSIVLLALLDDLIQSANVHLVSCSFHCRSSALLSLPLQPNSYMQT
jgi:hypothetical protein